MEQQVLDRLNAAGVNYAIANIPGGGRPFLGVQGFMVSAFSEEQALATAFLTEFLAEATTLFPEAKSVLLTAYADTNAAIEAINIVGLDHYLMKPWEPPEQMLYPLLDDLLEQWRV